MQVDVHGMGERREADRLDELAFHKGENTAEHLISLSYLPLSGQRVRREHRTRLLLIIKSIILRVMWRREEKRKALL